MPLPASAICRHRPCGPSEEKLLLYLQEMDALTLAAFRLSRITAIRPARQRRTALLCCASLTSSVAYSTSSLANGLSASSFARGSGRPQSIQQSSYPSVSGAGILDLGTLPTVKHASPDDLLIGASTSFTRPRTIFVKPVSH